MKRTILSIVMTSMVLSLAAPVFAQSPLERERDRLERQQRQEQRDAERNANRNANSKDAKGVLNDRVKEINKLADRQDSMALAIKTTSIETGVPQDRVENMHKHHRDMGPAGLLLANVMAAETKKDPEFFMKQKSNGKSWNEIARENNVPTEKLTVRLDNMERALNRYGNEPGASNRGNREQNRQQQRENRR